MSHGRSASRTARRTAIAEAALAVLAERGGHGLTHRAVDAALSLPPGSTSYYFNSRVALLSAASDALFEADRADLSDCTDADGAVDADALMRRWLAPDARTRLVARLEFFLEASRNPDFRARMARQREHFLTAARSAAGGQEQDGTGAAERALRAFEGEMLNMAAFGLPGA